MQVIPRSAATRDPVSTASAEQLGIPRSARDDRLRPVLKAPSRRRQRRGPRPSARMARARRRRDRRRRRRRPERREAFVEALPERPLVRIGRGAARRASRSTSSTSARRPRRTRRSSARRLARSLHVLCEKPLVLSPEELARPARRWRRRRSARSSPSTTGATRRSSPVGELVRSRRHRRGPPLPLGDAARPAAAAGRRGGELARGPRLGRRHPRWITAGTRSTSSRPGCRTRRARWPRGCRRGGTTSTPVEDTAELVLVYPAALGRDLPDVGGGGARNRVEVSGTRGTLRLDGGRLSLSGRRRVARRSRSGRSRR